MTILLLTALSATVPNDKIAQGMVG